MARIYFQQNKLSPDSLDAILSEIKRKNSKIPYSFAFSFLESVSNRVNIGTSRVIKNASGSEIDYREVYDRTSKWSNISDFYKKHFL